jgi:hypothetical protein
MDCKFCIFYKGHSQSIWMILTFLYISKKLLGLLLNKIRQILLLAIKLPREAYRKLVRPCMTNYLFYSNIFCAIQYYGFTFWSTKGCLSILLNFQLPKTLFITIKLVCSMYSYVNA